MERTSMPSEVRALRTSGSWNGRMDAAGGRRVRSATGRCGSDPSRAPLRGVGHHRAVLRPQAGARESRDVGGGDPPEALDLRGEVRSIPKDRLVHRKAVGTRRELLDLLHQLRLAPCDGPLHFGGLDLTERVQLFPDRALELGHVRPGEPRGP
jgi:hypothetical protein